MPRAATKTSQSSKDAHPSYIEMITVRIIVAVASGYCSLTCLPAFFFQEAITETKERTGVSRQLIKSFIEERYAVQMNGMATTNISRALRTGEEKGVFVMPKGTLLLSTLLVSWYSCSRVVLSCSLPARSCW